MKQKHDNSYHRLFSEPELFEDLIRNFVDEPWVAKKVFRYQFSAPYPARGGVGKGINTPKGVCAPIFGARGAPYNQQLSNL